MERRRLAGDSNEIKIKCGFTREYNESLKGKHEPAHSSQYIEQASSWMDRIPTTRQDLPHHCPNENLIKIRFVLLKLLHGHR